MNVTVGYGTNRGGSRTAFNRLQLDGKATYLGVEWSHRFMHKDFNEDAINLDIRMAF